MSNIAADPTAVQQWSDWLKIILFGLGGAGGAYGLFRVLKQAAVGVWKATMDDNVRLRGENEGLREKLEIEHSKRVTAEKRADKAEDRMDDMESGRIQIGGADQ